MMSAKTRLMFAAGLFMAWLGWLVFLVAQSRDPIILSRPQLVMADVVVTAKLSGDDHPDSAVTIVEILSVSEGIEKPAAGQSLDVFFLSECKTENHGWEGPGEYILALKRRGKDYRLQEVPLSPGYPASEAETREKYPSLRIYRATEDALRQAEEFRVGRSK